MSDFFSYFSEGFILQLDNERQARICRLTPCSISLFLIVNVPKIKFPLVTTKCPPLLGIRATQRKTGGGGGVAGEGEAVPGGVRNQMTEPGTELLVN